MSAKKFAQEKVGLERKVKEFLKSDVLPYVQERWKSSVEQPDCIMVCNATCAAFYLRSFADVVEYCTVDPDDSPSAWSNFPSTRTEALCIYSLLESNTTWFEDAHAQSIR